MKKIITIDPELNMHTSEFVQVIIEFRTRPAHILNTIQPTITIEQANELVEKSHQEFQKELDLLLEAKGHSYKILHQYTASLNGVALELQGTVIQLLLSSQVIRGIYPNREMRIPEKPLM